MTEFKTYRIFENTFSLAEFVGEIWRDYFNFFFKYEKPW